MANARIAPVRRISGAPSKRIGALGSETFGPIGAEAQSRRQGSASKHCPGWSVVI
jgi:hypothetical protein